MASLEEAHTVKPDKFNGLNFKRWKNQMRYWLTVLGLISAIEEPNESSIGSTSSWYTLDQIEYHCLNRILSALSERLYDVYCTTPKANDLWNALEAEYGIDDAGIKRFNVSSFYKFVMVDGKSINEQVHGFLDYLRLVEMKGNRFREDFKVRGKAYRLDNQQSNSMVAKVNLMENVKESDNPN
ncbi:hypothetical protein RJ639_033408 [Escallonia herrerae]|uniref:Uncharacterized protein n=1 Tax=Escallonia herrerae TaxID=1293975 RepID=A0AA88WWT6_9ASTE|nr:hypothetical protein RJ639_033408 [Escallonia herrerae]